MANKGAKSRGKPRSRAAVAQRRVRALLPASVRSHLKASIRECLLAFESLFDEAVKVLEKERGEKPGRRGKKIRVE